MLYYTQLLYVNEGGEEGLRNFERRTIPILERHGGRLMLLSKVDKRHPENVGDAEDGTPDEIHLLSFPDRVNFLNYMRDPERTEMLHLKENSVKSAILFEGQEVNMAALKQELSQQT